MIRSRTVNRGLDDFTQGGLARTNIAPRAGYRDGGSALTLYLLDVEAKAGQHYADR